MWKYMYLIIFAAFTAEFCDAGYFKYTYLPGIHLAWRMLIKVLGVLGCTAYNARHVRRGNNLDQDKLNCMSLRFRRFSARHIRYLSHLKCFKNRPPTVNPEVSKVAITDTWMEFARNSKTQDVFYTSS
ncbi:uncharacterized protein F4807DRAFT_73774 [Annulohypoxylon truncatum]|uniref:uncharacterized protein n=1 Tax=Annulohypoxylon truncatum TaxID=327061 RepID=UPI00200825FE|nr:uncharacterized protein F4807DRAFT_73774 [Annulohypoxylon truncatum]KAI1210241.1 hypothetical protein F4807DRAFT_73774 [Annulohypoxylon truncatum]